MGLDVGPLKDEGEGFQFGAYGVMGRVEWAWVWQSGENMEVVRCCCFWAEGKIGAQIVPSGRANEGVRDDRMGEGCLDVDIHL